MNKLKVGDTIKCNDNADMISTIIDLGNEGIETMKIDGRDNTLVVTKVHGEKKTITQQFEDIVKDMCDNFCKFPLQEAPLNDDGTSNDNWLFEDGSPCENCPLNKL